MLKMNGRLLLICLLMVFLNGCTYYDIDEIRSEKKINKVEIEFWYGLSGSPNKLMKQYIEEFNSLQEDYYVVGVEQSSYEETFKALKSSIARKKVPSVVLLENQHLYYLASKGVMQNLNHFKDNDLDDFIESYLVQSIINEDIMGMPMYGTTSVIYYRKDFFEQYGLKPVDLLTWESVDKVADKLTQKNNDEILVYGWELRYGARNLIDAAISNGGNFLSSDGKEVLINSQEWVEAWEFFRKLIFDKKTMKVHYGGDSLSYWYANIDDLMQGRSAGYIGSCEDRSELDPRVIGTYILPAWDNKMDNPRGVINLHSLSIPIYVEGDMKTGAIEWIRYLTSKEKSLDWLVNTGFLPIRKSTMDEDEFYEIILKNPDYFMPIRQVKLGTKIFIDPTDGKIYELLENAANKVLIENISSLDALTEAQNKAQEILDTMINEGR